MVVASSDSQIDQALQDLQQGASRISALSFEKRISIIDKCIHATNKVAREWVEAACSAKGIAVTSPSRAEEIAAGPVSAIRYLRLIHRSFSDLAHESTPKLPNRPTLKNGQIRVPVFPTRFLYDKIIFRPLRVETWLQKDVSESDIFELPNSDSQPMIALVLGAGNVSAIPLTDSLTKIFQENKAVLLKMNPVNEYLGPIFEKAMAALVEADLLRIVYGGADIGHLAIHHDQTDEVHITGSTASHNQIVWGAPEVPANAVTPILQKTITSELGNVTPWIIVPGDYSEKQLRFQAENVVASITNNASFNCIATKMIITSESWKDRARFLDIVEELLSQIPPRAAYYPGAFERYEQFSGQTPEPNEAHTLPWTLIRDVKQEASPHLFAQESFVCVCAESALHADSPSAFFSQAVRFVNEQLWGTLACAITVPKSFPNQNADEFDRCLRELRYGMIGINQWPGIGYALMSPPWGGFAGSELHDVQSGIGFVHNTFMLKRPEKSILYSPLTMAPKPLWFSTHRCPEALAWSLLNIYNHPSWHYLPRLFWHALRG